MEETELKKLNKKMVSTYLATLVSVQFHSKISSIQYLGGGSFGTAYKIVQDKEPHVLVAKAYKVDGMHKKEAYDLRVLATHTKMKYPTVYFVHDATAQIPISCMCMEFIGGKSVFVDFALLLKSKKKKRAFAEAVVDSMLEIHSFTNPKFGLIENPIYTSWLEYYKPFAADILATAQQLRIDGKLSASIVNTMEQAFERFDDIFFEDIKEASLIHGDLNVSNIMVKMPFEVTAIIDPLEARFADREYDLFQLNNMTGKQFGLYNLYKEKYPTSKNCDAKCAFYGLWNEVYCFITAGTLFKFIMNPLVKKMRAQLQQL